MEPMKEQMADEVATLRQRIAELEQQVRDQKSAEAKVLETKVLFEGLFELNPDAIILVDTKGIITRVNAQAANLFGYSYLELVGKPHDLLLPEKLTQAHESHMAGYIASPRTRKMGAPGLELYGRKKDGTIFPVDISLGALGARGEFITVIAVIRTRSPL